MTKAARPPQAANARQENGLEQELQRTCRRRAPTARRSPISRVRSVTLMNITLAIPIAPMSRLTAARPT